MNRYRIWWGKIGYQQDIFEAETAADALTIATLNFSLNNLKPVKIEAVSTEEVV